jgi:hypothetical protein
MLWCRAQRRFLIFNLLVCNLSILVGFKALKGKAREESKTPWVSDPPQAASLVSGATLALNGPQTISHQVEQMRGPLAVGRLARYTRLENIPKVSSTPFRFLIQGGLHGDEISTVRAVRWLAQRYQRRQSALNQLDPWGVSIDFLPVANPSGFVRAERSNERGVNLNRNFSVLWGHTSENPGRYPFSEQETKLIRQFAEQRQYVAAVDLHGYVPWIVGPSSPQVLLAKGIRSTQGKIETHRLWTKALEKEANKLDSYSLQSAGELGDGGAFEDWAFWKMDIYAFCLELKEPLSQDRELSLNPRRFYEDDFSQEDEMALKTYEATIARLFMYSIYLTKKYPQLSRLDSL